MHRNNDPRKYPKGDKQAYILPLAPGGFTLTLDTLNQHSDFSYSRHLGLHIQRRAISFQNEVLTMGIHLGGKKEERVYLRVLHEGLSVWCSAGTSSTYLSRYAYFALYSLLRIAQFYDFSKYYWPGFFSPKTGKSKYLTVSMEGNEIKVKRKPEYAFFYKPGDKLIFPFKEKRAINSIEPDSEKDELNHLNPYPIGYCLADTRLRSFRSPHFPFLVCYAGIWHDNQMQIKNFKEFLTTPEQTASVRYTPLQVKINSFSRKMRMLAPIKSLGNSSTEKEKQAIKKENIGTMKLVYALWQKAVPLLHTQPFTHHLQTFGMHNVKGKPRKQDMQPCTFSPETPELCFLWSDKGTYYELELRPKVGSKLQVPYAYSPTFFVHARNRPFHFYLLDSVTDYQVMYFFENHNFKISVLKTHYQGRFGIFLDRLAKIYELIHR